MCCCWSTQAAGHNIEPTRCQIPNHVPACRGEPQAQENVKAQMTMTGMQPYKARAMFHRSKSVQGLQKAYPAPKTGNLGYAGSHVASFEFRTLQSTESSVEATFWGQVAICCTRRGTVNSKANFFRLAARTSEHSGSAQTQIPGSMHSGPQVQAGKKALP